MNSRKLPQVLGLIACALAWTAALITYRNTGEIRIALIAAGLFFAMMPIASGARKSK
jgi:hypothetical protein